MFIHLFLAQLLLNVLSSCPLYCMCKHGIVTCVDELLTHVPINIPEHTRILNLNDNKIRVLSDSSLSSLPQLEELHIQNNLLSTISKNSFKKNAQLKLLNLMNNKLVDLSETLFISNNHLVQIDVRDNPQLSYIPYSLFDHLYTLKSLLANNVECNCAMEGCFNRISQYDYNDINIDITCSKPAEYRGYNLRDLPDTTFYNCYDDSFKCIKGEVACADRTCILRDRWCDGNYDCHDLSDEADCTNRADEVVCDSETQFQCSSDGKCISSSWVCDTFLDCEDNSDELYCSNDISMCGTGYYECSNKRCVNQTALCDQINDCGDWSDESKMMCGGSNSHSLCPGGWVPCASDGRCIVHTHVCDGVENCNDGSDERNCGNCTAQCSSNGRCIDPSWLCDHQPDCPDFSDEENCDYTCGEEEFQCALGGCVGCVFLCDGIQDCKDGSDEENCSVCDGALCALESVQDPMNITTVIVIAAAVCTCISIICLVLFIVLCKQLAQRTPQPPHYTEIQYDALAPPLSPPPRYKSEPDILAGIRDFEQQTYNLELEGSSDTESIQTSEGV